MTNPAMPEPDNPSAPVPVSRKKLIKDMLRLVSVAAFFVAAALILKNPYVRQQLFDIETMRRELQGGGLRSTAIFVLTASLVNALGVPRVWICGLAGSLFGAVEGTIIGYGATLLGSSINFLMGRSLLRGPIKRHMPRRMRSWYEAFNNHGFRAILYLRLFPLSNATLTNLMGGASRLRYREYILATAIGYIPFTVAFATLGSSAAKQNEWQLVLGLVLFASIVLGQWLWSRKRKSAARQSEDFPADKDSSVNTVS